MTNKIISKFFTKSEEVTYKKLHSVCERMGAKVFAKVRLVDVLRCFSYRPVGEKLTFSMKSHLDFVVVSSENVPLFSVEFDGPSHKHPVQAKRDRLKNELLHRIEHPLLRINSRYFDARYRGFDLLTYIIDVWFLAESFYEAQENEIIPLDETFDPNFLSITDSIYRQPWPWNLSYDIIKEMRTLHNNGKLIQSGPCNLVGSDGVENLRCLNWIFLEPNEAVFAKTGMRHQDFQPIDFTDILEHIALNDLYKSLSLALKGNRKTVTAQRIMAEMKLFKNKYQIRASLSCGYSKPPGFQESITIFSSSNS